MDNDTHVLEWSQKQNAMHIVDEKLSIENNLQALYANRSIDCVVIARGSREFCDSVRSQLRPRLKESQPVRKSYDRSRH